MPNAKRLQRALKNPAAFQHQIERRIFYENRKRKSIHPTIPQSGSLASPLSNFASNNTCLFAPTDQPTLINPSLPMPRQSPFCPHYQNPVVYDPVRLVECDVPSGNLRENNNNVGASYSSNSL